MTPRTLAVLGALVLSPPAADPARALDAGAIVTGGPGSTAFRVGQDIAGLARRFGVALEVVPSQGGPGAIEVLARRPGALLAVVPSDVLGFVAGFAQDPELRPMAALHAVFPLHAEEVHVLARPEVATFADLRGRRVAVGAPNSGTLLTATLLLGAAGVRPAEELRIGGGEALAALREGRADALVHVGGRPVALFQDGVAIEDALHLVPVDHPAFRDLYPAAAIPAGTYYPWQPDEVPTVAPRAVLVTPRWAERGDRQQEEACRLVGKIARAVADDLDRLRREGHPKWREVDPRAETAGWERSPCVEQALAGPEGHALDALGGAPSGGMPAPEPSGAAPVPAGRPARPSGTSAPDACSAERDPILRRLCEVRPLLRAEP